MNYTEYMVMIGYRTEQELLDKKVNEQYRVNQHEPNEKPQRSRPPRFWWHHDPNMPDDKKR